MPRLLVSATTLLVFWVMAPTLSVAAYQKGHAAAQKIHPAPRPIKANATSWKANVGTLKTYAKAANPNAVHAVGQRAVHYPAPNVTIDALLAKRALNPAKFDQTYKNIGRLLARDDRLRAAGNAGPLNGLLYPSATHNYLLWRRSLNPARFDYYHPVLGVILAEHNRIQNLVSNPTNPNPPTTPTNPNPGELTPPETNPVSPPGIPAGGSSVGGPPSGTPSGPPGLVQLPPGVVVPSVVPEPRSLALVLLGAMTLAASSALRKRLGRGPVAPTT